ncbi:alpha/beta hydrolase [Sphaerisporangium album]|uniref:Alpha/beta hydrolase n=2 Tax=Sphaerisporangium album TaxID=509200 RepID=A0A367FM38_9ACTN|nr:alpha/beta hydrolase [Sphaerisporangium album]
MVRSADGTDLAYERLGEGAPVVLVTGASCDRNVHEPLARLLATEFTVLNYDRRGRGESGDTLPYAVDREIEDLEALINEAGGTAAVFGSSSGAVLALHAAASGLPITRLALWEPPFTTDPDGPRRQHAYATTLTTLLGEGRRGDAVALFMGLVGIPEEMISGMRHAPMWAGMEALAPTLAYDAAVMGDGTMPADLVALVKAPTLVVHGTETGDWMGESARALAAALPHGTSHTLQGQSHDVSSDVLAPVLKEFLA